MLLRWFDRSWISSRTWYHTNLYFYLYLDTDCHDGGHVYLTSDSDRDPYPNAQQYANHNRDAVTITNRH